jgi:tetratricopeptide (TPR) repeat protein
MDDVKRVLAGIVLLVLTGAAVYGYTLSERERAYRLKVADGDDALAHDNTAAAIEAFSGAITLKPDSMLGYLRRGQAYHRRGEFGPAIRDLHRASEIDPTATRPLEELGDVYLDDTPHRYPAAAGRYEAYVRIDNKAPRVLYKLAYARYNQGLIAEAIDALHASLVQDSKSAEAYYLLGLCERDAQHLELARQSLMHSIQLQPTLLHAREELADLYGAMGNTEARLEQLSMLNALDARPSREIALGLAYDRAGQPERAVLTLSHAAERYPDQPYVYVALGRVWLEIAQARHDRVALNKALEALEGAAGNDDSSEALTLFGRALLLTADADSAERMLQGAVEKQPVEPLAFFYLAEAAQRQGHYVAARQALLDYTALRGDEPDARKRSAETIRLAELSLRIADPASAAVYFLKASDAAPSDATLLARAADAQFRAGDRDTARGTAARALEKDPTNQMAIDVLRRAGR